MADTPFTLIEREKARKAELDGYGQALKAVYRADTALECLPESLQTLLNELARGDRPSAQAD